jgi:hypothetical protein
MVRMKNMSWIRLREAKAGKATATRMRKSATIAEMDDARVRV